MGLPFARIYESHTCVIDGGTWRILLPDKTGRLALSLTGGVAFHAVNVHIVIAVLPSVAQDIGDLDWYA